MGGTAEQLRSQFFRLAGNGYGYLANGAVIIGVFYNRVNNQ